ncbi:MAG: NAD(P)/FAD-dependent oxidoreductase [Candidatus Bipolaricaulia bacterium]
MSQVVDVAIIGGGIVGCAIAERLIQETDLSVWLFEKQALAAGTTGRSVGVFGIQHPTELDIRLRQESFEVYQELVSDPEVSVEYVRTGYLHISTSETEAVEIRRTVDRVNRLGGTARCLSAEQAAEIVPGLYVDDLQEVGYAPEDGYFDGSELTNAFAHRAVRAGVKLNIGVAVQDIVVRGNRVRKLITEAGPVETEVVINATGPWGRQMGEMVGLELPICGVPGQILVVRPQKRFSRVMPMVFNRDTHAYFRGEGTDRLLLGWLDKRYREDGGINPDRLPNRPFPEFRERAIAETVHRLPAMESAALVGGWVGAREVTPDRYPILGESSVRRFFCAIGFSGHGIQLAPAAARIVSEAIQGKGSVPKMLSIDRFEREGVYRYE